MWQVGRRPGRWRRRFGKIAGPRREGCVGRIRIGRAARDKWPRCRRMLRRGRIERTSGCCGFTGRQKFTRWQRFTGSQRFTRRRGFDRGRRVGVTSCGLLRIRDDRPRHRCAPRIAGRHIPCVIRAPGRLVSVRIHTRHAPSSPAAGPHGPASRPHATEAARRGRYRIDRPVENPQFGPLWITGAATPRALADLPERRARRGGPRPSRTPTNRSSPASGRGEWDTPR
jgi:hypothetical protein